MKKVKDMCGIWKVLFKVENELFDVECEALRRNDIETAKEIEEIREKIWKLIRKD